MRFILLLHATDAEWRSFGRRAAFLGAVTRQLEVSGELVSEAWLTGPEQARTVCARGGGAPDVTPAPLPAGREFLARFWMVDSESTERAVEIAARVSAAAGRSGTPGGAMVELRRVMMAPGEDM